MTGTASPRSTVDRRPCFRRHRVLSLLAVNLAALVFISGFLEAAYRRQWIDFHRADLAAFNPPEVLAPSTRPTILALGDSFTAGRDNWPAGLQEILGPTSRVVNSGVGGTTIRHMRIIAEGRIRRFNPRLVICQVYSGNDLVDLHHAAKPGRSGRFRRLYWFAVDGGLVLPWYLNTRLRQIINFLSPAHRMNPAETKRIIAEMEARPFSPEHYSPRSAMLLAASPTLIADQITVTGEMATAWSIYQGELDGLVERCSAHAVPLLLVVVPHCTQVHKRYGERFQALGARFPDPTVLTTDESPFVSRVRAAAGRTPGVEVLDVLPTLRLMEENGVELFFANDPHLNPNGRRILARTIADAVESR